jgi:cell division protein FtsL
MEKIISKEINWEKIGVYLSILVGFMTVMFYIVEMKVDIAKLQVKVEKLEK